MIGALIGDIAGSRFEHHNRKSKVFTLLSAEKGCCLTDDSIMTLAIAQAVLNCKGSYDNLEQQAVSCMQNFGREYPFAGYGERFEQWIWADAPHPYNSYGNGAAMRVSPCGYAAGSVNEAAALARAVTRVSHNHPEALKAAQAVSEAIFLARNGAGLSDIREYIELCYYRLDFTLDEIRKDYCFNVSCQGSVPQAFLAFFEAEDFEDAVRNAVSLGGDSDTIAAIAGSLAGAYFGVPDELRREALSFLDDEQKAVLFAFEKKFGLFDHRSDDEISSERVLFSELGLDQTPYADSDYMQYRREYGPYSGIKDLARHVKREKSENIRARETDFIKNLVLGGRDLRQRPDAGLIAQWMKDSPKAFFLDEALWPDTSIKENPEAYYVKTDGAFLNYAEVLRLELTAPLYRPDRVRLALYFFRVIDTYLMDKSISQGLFRRVPVYEKHFNRVYEQFYTIIMDDADLVSRVDEDCEQYCLWSNQLKSMKEALFNPDRGMISNLEKGNYGILSQYGNTEKFIDFAEALYSLFFYYSDVSGFVPESAVRCMFFTLHLFHGLFVKRNVEFQKVEEEYRIVFERLYKAMLEGSGYLIADT